MLSARDGVSSSVFNSSQPVHRHESANPWSLPLQANADVTAMRITCCDLFANHMLRLICESTMHDASHGRQFACDDASLIECSESLLVEWWMPARQRNEPSGLPIQKLIVLEVEQCNEMPPIPHMRTFRSCREHAWVGEQLACSCFCQNTTGCVHSGAGSGCQHQIALSTVFNPETEPGIMVVPGYVWKGRAFEVEEVNFFVGNTSCRRTQGGGTSIHDPGSGCLIVWVPNACDVIVTCTPRSCACCIVRHLPISLSQLFSLSPVQAVESGKFGSVVVSAEKFCW
ncbi:uncharacterized protein [Physcomitrium patens]|uniref:uncharacterized protein isoform X1 n=1 Tax=Physcomitrium patens TaxID=3218 RepID=UPI003CCCC6F4